MRPIVVKVGGSLFDLPDLKARLEAFLPALTPPVLLVPGGGAMADVVRRYDSVHGLGDEASHWLALKACSLNGQLLSRLLGNLPVISAVPSLAPIAVVDLFAFAQADESRPDHWPHHWDVTSDSMSVRVAQVAHAKELMLLKSVDVADDWNEAAERGHVDRYFSEACERAPKLPIRAINLRTTAP